jgi:hypothetical protein
MPRVSPNVFAAGLALALVASCGSRYAAKGTSDGEAPDGADAPSVLPWSSHAAHSHAPTGPASGAEAADALILAR